MTVADLVSARYERDTYRDLCVDLLQILRCIDGSLDDDSSPSDANSITARTAITKAETILGEKND